MSSWQTFNDDLATPDRRYESLSTSAQYPDCLSAVYANANQSCANDRNVIIRFRFANHSFSRAVCRTMAVSHKGPGLAFPMSKESTAAAAPPAAPPAAPLPEAKKVHGKTRTGGPRTLFVRDVIREVAGWAPYERRAQDIIKLDKPRAARFYLKKRLGSFDRARRKQLYLEEIIREEARQHEHHHAHAHDQPAK
jgi:hypothetical protein